MTASKKHRITLSLINVMHIFYCNDDIDKIPQAAAVPLAGGDLQLPGAGPHLPAAHLPRLPPPQPAQVPGGQARVHPRHGHRQHHQAHPQLQRHRTQVQTLASHWLDVLFCTKFCRQVIIQLHSPGSFITFTSIFCQ